MSGARALKGQLTGSFADLRMLLGRARPPLAPLVLAALLTLVEVGGTLAFPLLTRDIVDRLGRGAVGAASLFADRAVLQLLGVLLAAAAAAALGRYLTARAGLQLVARLKLQLIERLIGAPVAWFDGIASGEPTSRVMNDTRAIATLVSRETLNAGAGALLLIGAAVLLFSMDAALAAILFGVIGAAFALMLPVILTIAAVSFRVQAVTAALSARLTQVFGEIRMVKTFGAEARERRAAQDGIGELFALGRRTAAVEAALSPVMTLAVTVSLVVILAYGGMRVAAGTLSAGTLMAFLLYIFTVVGPLAQITAFFSHLSSARGAAVRLAETLRAPAEPRGRDEAGPIAAGGALAIEALRFGYGPDRAILAIDALSFAAGTRTALIGPSGSGKSTLLALIERFYAPAAGSIRYGGRDIAELPLAEWRARIGYVAQNSPMLAGTVRDNLLYGIDRPVGESEIARALALAHATRFVARFADGLDTDIGERGVRLSGGERQRLAIARMFLRDPEILLLDEATAHLDEESAHLVSAGLDTLMHGRTCILVTHRLSGLEAMDAVVMIEDGRITAAGPPAVLLARSPAYRRIVTRTFAEETHA